MTRREALLLALSPLLAPLRKLLPSDHDLTYTPISSVPGDLLDDPSLYSWTWRTFPSDRYCNMAYRGHFASTLRTPVAWRTRALGDLTGWHGDAILVDDILDDQEAPETPET